MTAFIKSDCECDCDAVTAACEDCNCFSGDISGNGTGSDQSGPCVDFLTAVSEEAPKTGLYECNGGVDDQATVTWQGGSFFSPANQPGIGPCYGAHNFSFTAYVGEGTTMKCEAGSWGGGVGCNFTCCLIEAP